jgi:hypothetical protein
MKKITLLLFAIFSFWQINAQVNSYSFSQNMGTYTPITGGTVLGTASNDDTSFNGLTIGFTFKFNDVDYTQVSVNSNGFVGLGATVGSSYNSLSSGSSNNVLAAFNTDIQSNAITGELSYLLEGTAPNQTFTIQWKSYRSFGSTGDDYNFQVILHETSNVIDFKYGTVVQNATDRSMQVGLRGQANTNFINRTTTTDWSATTAGLTNAASCTLTTAIVPASGLTFTWTPPICPAPTVLNTFNITTASADVTWNIPSIVPSNGYEYVATNIAGLPTGSGTVSATNTVALSGLSSNTLYNIYVRSNCGTSFGNWVSLGTFKTLCSVFLAPYTENFSNAGAIPSCWDMYGGDVWKFSNTIGSNNIGNAGVNTGNTFSGDYFAWVDDSGTAATDVTLLSPFINVSALTTPRLTFFEISHNQGVQNNCVLTVSVWDGAAWNEMAVYNTNTVNGWEKKTIDLSSLTITGPIQLQFVVAEDPTGFRDDIAIDDVTVENTPTCIEPNTVVVANVTATSADISWNELGTATQWSIEYGSIGFTPGTGTVVAAPTNPFTLSSLMPNTTYGFYVRAICSPTDTSNLSVPKTFKTRCLDATEVLENFDSYGGGSSSPMPDCWSKGGTGTTYISFGSSAPMSPGMRLYMASGTAPKVTLAILPAISNLQANTHRLRFKAYATAALRVLDVGYLTVQTDVTTFVLIEQVVLPVQIENTLTFTVTPTTIPAGVKYLAIRNPGFPGSSTTAFLDDIEWQPILSCPEPDLLTLGTINSNSATLSWTEMGSAALWNIEYGVTGYNQGAGTLVSGVTTNPYILSGLTSATTYDYYVQADCGATSGSSIWSGPYTFTTECIVVNAPYTEGFANAGAIPACWSMSGGEDWKFWNTTFDPVVNSSTYVGLNGVIEGSTVTNGYFAWVDDFFDPTNDVTLKSPLISLFGITNPRLTFYELSNNAGNANATLKVEVWDGAAWNLMATYNTNTLNGWEKKIIPLNGLTFTGDLQVRFIVLGSTSFFDSIAIDDVTIEATPTTIPACVSNIVVTLDPTCGNRATTITWDASLLADGNYLTIGTTPGGNDILNNVNIGAGSVYSYAGLENTTYYYKIVPFNAIGLAAGCVEQSFTTVATGCYCPSVPTSTDGAGITNVQLGTTDFYNAPAVTYFDNTATPITFEQGLNTNVKVSFSTILPYTAFLLIDFNDNYVFETSEIVYTGTASGGTALLDASFIMPADAALGTHRMRLLSRRQYAEIPNSCYSGTYGVTLDFSINVITTPCATLAPTGSATQTFCEVSTVADLVATGTTIKWYDAATFGNLLVSTDVLVDGTTYYASETLTCEGLDRLAVTASVIAPLATPVGVATQTFCMSANITELVVSGSNVMFYDAATGGNLIPFNTSEMLTDGTMYYATSTNMSCESPTRLAIAVVVNSTVAPTGTATQTFCGVSNITQLVATGSGIKWYDAATGGNFLPNIAAIGLVDGTTYYASQTVNGCEGTTRFPVLVEITQSVVATFAPVASFCSGTTAPTLSLMSSNTISGTWSPAVVDNTTSGTYTFTPDAGQCGLGTTINVSVTTSAATPTGAASQTVSVPVGTDVVIGDLIVSPSTVVWYTSLADAQAGTSPIAAGTVLTDGVTYYAVDQSIACVSSPLAVTLTVLLSSDGFDTAGFIAYPNPVNDVLNVSYSAEITSVKVINLLGQEVLSKNVGTNSTQIDMSTLSAGTYIVNVTIGDVVKTIKVLKK